MLDHGGKVVETQSTLSFRPSQAVGGEFTKKEHNSGLEKDVCSKLLGGKKPAFWEGKEVTSEKALTSFLFLVWRIEVTSRTASLSRHCTFGAIAKVRRSPAKRPNLVSAQ